jgi:hypothetical protein
MEFPGAANWKALPARSPKMLRMILVRLMVVEYIRPIRFPNQRKNASFRLPAVPFQCFSSAPPVIEAPGEIELP